MPDTSEHGPISNPSPVREHRGPLSWMTKNSVAANLLMVVLILGGLVFLNRVRQEVFPSFALDVINISIAYPGASPDEVEHSVTKAVEEAVRGVDGVKQVTSTSSESSAGILVELLLGTNPNRALSDIKATVDRITSFPEDVERPTISIIALRNRVISLVLYGPVSEKTLRALAEKTRDQLLQDPRITTVDFSGVRPLEVSVEIPRAKLRSYGLTLQQVASTIRAANVEVPAGGVKTDRGEILLRTTERRDFGRHFERIVVRSLPDGTQVKLSDIATVQDSFKETDQIAMFNGEPAVMVRAIRVGEQTPITVSNAVHEYLEANQHDLPPGVKLAVWNDRSEMYRARIDLLMRNAYLGLALVLFTLGLFLEIRLAFWVTLGIPISFLGTLIFLPGADVSINMISLFAFIVTLGIVVDDAIVVGEAIHKRKQEGLPLVKAAVVGVHDVARPVIFSVLTTVVAFSPLLFVPGVMGKFFRVIPIVVITVLMMSLVESLLVLPAHLAHENGIAIFVRRQLRKILGERMGPFGAIYRAQQRFSDRVARFINGRFVPALKAVVRERYVSVAVAFAILIMSFGIIAGGRIDFTFLPKIQLDVVFVQLKMPYGTPYTETRTYMDRMVGAGRELLDESGGEDKLSRGIFSQVGSANFGGMGHPRRGGGAVGGHVAEVAVFMVPVDERKITAQQFAQRWRKKIGDIPGADSLKFSFTAGATSSAPISFEISHRDVATLEKAATDFANKLRDYSGVKDIDDGFALGKEQLDFRLKPEARSLGITEIDLARQVRASFFGAEAGRQQRGRDELRIYVRLPKQERASLYDVEELLVFTPNGGEVPLKMAASVTQGFANTQIKRRDGRRVLTIAADVEENVTNANRVVADLKKNFLPELLRRYPSLNYRLAGQQQEQAESLGALGSGYLLALLAIFALMAVPFRSYVQPLIIMSAIPFGLVGALAGHLLMGYNLSILSAMGFVALSGVVINDSLVLITAINEFRAQGMTAYEAVVAGAARRFRPIILTSLTTFLGLMPMMLESSMQARFLIPMALSLGFGVLFATFIILLIVPCFYLLLEELRGHPKHELYDPGPADDAVTLNIQGMPAE